MENTKQFTDQELRQTVEYLQNLVAINTTNPPGNETLACRYLAQIFDKEKIPYHILESAPGRGSIIARLKGDGTLLPLLLTSHLDVVPCEKDKWTHDPFSGVIRDGCIWGRGTVDMKQMTAMSLAIFLKSHRESIPLKRDLIFAAVADEEAGCRYGSEWLVENHPDLLRAEYALNEVGAFTLHINDKRFYPIGVAEKGLCWFKLKARGEPGHAAVPHQHQALVRLTEAAYRLTHRRFPFHRTEIFEAFVNTLAAHQGLIKGLVLKGTTKKLFSDFILNNLFPDPSTAQSFRNMYRNLATPTVMRAGQKVNVIPAEAELEVDGRILPGQTVESFLAEVMAIVGDDVEIEVFNAREPNVADHNNAFYKELEQALIKADPEAIPVPYLIPGFTDAKFYSKLGVKTYGFVPTRLPKGVDFKSLYHGHDERIPVDAIYFGVQVLWDVIQRSCL